MPVWQQLATPGAISPNRIFIGAQIESQGECLLVDDVLVTAP
jgi:hypothetical protein